MESKKEILRGLLLEIKKRYCERVGTNMTHGQLMAALSENYVFVFEKASFDVAVILQKYPDLYHFLNDEQQDADGNTVKLPVLQQVSARTLGENFRVPDERPFKTPLPLICLCREAGKSYAELCGILETFGFEHLYPKELEQALLIGYAKGFYNNLTDLFATSVNREYHPGEYERRLARIRSYAPREPSTLSTPTQELVVALEKAESPEDFDKKLEIFQVSEGYRIRRFRKALQNAQQRMNASSRSELLKICHGEQWSSLISEICNWDKPATLVEYYSIFVRLHFSAEERNAVLNYCNRKLLGTKNPNSTQKRCLSIANEELRTADQNIHLSFTSYWRLHEKLWIQLHKIDAAFAAAFAYGASGRDNPKQHADNFLIAGIKFLLAGKVPQKGYPVLSVDHICWGKFSLKHVRWEEDWEAAVDVCDSYIAKSESPVANWLRLCCGVYYTLKTGHFFARECFYPDLLDQTSEADELISTLLPGPDGSLSSRGALNAAERIQQLLA